MSMQVEQQQLKAFLLDANLITLAQFETSLKKAKKQRKKVEEVLLADKLIKESDLTRLKAYILGIPFVSLRISHNLFVASSVIISFNKFLTAYMRPSISAIDPNDSANLPISFCSIGISHASPSASQ